MFVLSLNRFERGRKGMEGEGSKRRRCLVQSKTILRLSMDKLGGAVFLFLQSHCFLLPAIADACIRASYKRTLFLLSPSVSLFAPGV